MNPRERNLMIIVIAAAVAGIALYGTIYWFFVPLKEYRDKIETMTADNETLEKQLSDFIRDKLRLELGRKRSLPANPEQARLEYENFLKKVLREDNKLDFKGIKAENPQEVPVVSQIAGVKKTGHVSRDFKVNTITGNLKQLLGALADLQHAPYEHRVKTLSVNAARVDASDDNPKLEVELTMEVFLVAKTQNKIGAKIDGKLADPMPDRDYEKVAGNNIFAGLVPKVIYETVQKKEKKKTETKEKVVVKNLPKIDVLRFVKLTTTVPSQQTAYFRNELDFAKETKLIAKPMSGYEHFRIIDEDTGYVFFRAKVLKVGPREIYFQVKRDVYELPYGATLRDAVGGGIEEPLADGIDIFRLDDLDIEIDEEFATEEGAPKGGKKNSTPKKTGNPKRTR